MSRWANGRGRSSEGQAWLWGRAMLGEVGWLERNGWRNEGLEVMGEGLNIGESVVGACGGSAVFGPGNPSVPIHLWEKVGVKVKPWYC